jgi:hypothetical protein
MQNIFIFFIRKSLEKLRKEIKEKKTEPGELLLNLQINILNPEEFFKKTSIFMNNFLEIDPDHQIPPALSVLLNCDFVKRKKNKLLMRKKIMNQNLPLLR